MNIALITTQHTLYAALKASLGANFEIRHIQDRYPVEEYLAAESYDIAILDLNSAIGSLESRKELARTYTEAGISLILLADDEERAGRQQAHGDLGGELGQVGEVVGDVHRAGPPGVVGRGHHRQAVPGP